MTSLIARTHAPAGRRLLSGSILAIAVLSSVGSAESQVPTEVVGRVEVLDRAFDPHWLWATDALLARTSLVDLDDGAFLGQINSGWGTPDLAFSRTRSEIYVLETHFSRGTRGDRTDVATIYDARKLSPVGEVLLPPKRAINPLAIGNSAISDDDRFLAVFNMTPATSLSIVDLASRTLASEVSTPGCSLVYAMGERRFGSLCADGALLVVELDAEGRVAGRVRTEPFFDPQLDPVTEKAVRWGDRWVFVSFEGYAHVVDISGPVPRFEPRWSLLDARDRERSWRVGGGQHLAIHEASGRLYSLVHIGGTDTHKQSGSEVWVYDLEKRERIQRIELGNPGFTFLGVPVPLGNEWLNAFLLDYLVPQIGIDQIAVTQDDEPLMVTGAQYTGFVGVYDAMSGSLLRRLYTGNATSQGLLTLPKHRSREASSSTVRSSP